MWKLTGHPKTQKVTRALAVQFRDMEPAPQDRVLSERRLQVYEKIVRAGAFRPVSWAAAFCTQTGAQYRVNGKHTSTLFSGLDPLPELYAVIEWYECETLEDVARLYATYDSKTMSRTAADINRSFAGTIPGLSGVDDRVLNLSVAAIAYSKKLDRYKDDQPADRAEALLDNSDFPLWLQKLLGGGQTAKNAHLKRMAVFAAMFLTYRKVKGPSETFWKEVIHENHPDPTSPSRKLAKFLLLTYSTKGTRATAHLTRYRVSDREYFVKSLHAWNAWRAEEGTNLNYYANKPVPDVK